MHLAATPINRTQAHVEALQDLIQDVPSLQKNGYVVYPLLVGDLEKKQRCHHCVKLLNKHDIRKAAFVNPRLLLRDETIDGDGPSVYNSTNTYAIDGEINDMVQELTVHEPKKRCVSHPGRVYNRSWTCCDNGLGTPGCRKEEEHVPRQYGIGELEWNWKFFHTPRTPQQTHVQAVAIDCEMGNAESGEVELIRVSVIDYFTGRTLLDKLVFPDCKMAHYNTRYSGVTRQMINEARRRRTCIFGRANARKEVWKFVGPDTIVIGHGANGDLSSLRWIHHEVIDTYVLEQLWQREKELKEARERKAAGQEDNDEQEPGTEEEADKPKPKQTMSLKGLAKERLDRVIQSGNKGHDSVEDAIASRDLLDWYIVNRVLQGSVDDSIAP